MSSLITPVHRTALSLSEYDSITPAFVHWYMSTRKTKHRIWNKYYGYMFFIQLVQLYQKDKNIGFGTNTTFTCSLFSLYRSTRTTKTQDLEEILWLHVLYLAGTCLPERQKRRIWNKYYGYMFFIQLVQVYQKGKKRRIWNKYYGYMFFIQLVQVYQKDNKRAQRALERSPESEDF